MASVAHALFADDGPRSGRKKKKRGDSRSSKRLDAAAAAALGDAGPGGGGGDAQDVDAAWQQFTSPDGRPYYYNQVTQESRWKLPKALRHKQQRDEGSVEAAVELSAVGPRTQHVETTSEVPSRSRERNGRKPEAQQPDDKPAKSAGRGDIVARLQASLAGRINPMAGASGPPPMVKIPRSIPEASDADGRTRANSTGPDAGGLFSASEVFGSETAESQYDAETAGMTPAERLRFIRRKRQESIFKKEKIVEEDDFMKEFAMNMKKKEAERAQRMTPEELEKEQRETERKKRELEEKIRREDQERREQRQAEEQAEREKQRRREEEQRRWREEERKRQGEEQQEREAEEQRRREEVERKEQLQREEEKRRKKEEKAERRRVVGELEKRRAEEAREQAEMAEKPRKSADKRRTRSQGSSAAGLEDPFAAHFDLFHEGANEEENAPARTKRRSRSKGSKTFAADVVASNGARQSGSSSRRESTESIQPPGEVVDVEITPARSRQASTSSVDGAQIVADQIAEEVEEIALEEEDADAEAERERRERKERRRKKEKERRRLEQEAEDARHTEPIPPPPSSGCQCAACVHHGGASTPHHHHPPTSQPGYASPGSYPFYPQQYPPPPFYAPPAYGYQPPPPYMYAPPAPMMFPPAMIPPTMMATPMIGAPLSGGGMMINGIPVGTSSAIIVAPEYAHYAPPVLSQCQSCRGRGVGLAEKNGFCAHCNRLRLDFIVASSQIRKRCTSCGGWGLGLIQTNGMCSHCTRLTSHASVPNATIASSSKSEPPPPPVEWDASSSDSDWDD